MNSRKQSDDPQVPTADVGLTGREAGLEGEGDSVARVVASDEVLTKNFVAHIVEEVDLRVQGREARKQKIWNIVYVALGLIGISGVSAWINVAVEARVDKESARQEKFLKEVSQVAARKALDTEVSSLREELNSQSKYQQFTYLALSLEFEEDGFTNDERDLVMALLGDIAGSGSLRRNPDFPVLLENVIDSFASADQRLQLSKLARDFGDEAQGSQGISYTLVQHFGQALVGSSFPPDQWKLEDVELFEDFEEAASSHRSPEASLPYRLLIEYRKSDEMPSSLTRRLIEDVKVFRTVEDRATFYVLLFSLTDPSYWQKTPTVQGNNIGEVAAEFWKDHEPEIAAQLQDPELREAIRQRALLSIAMGREELGRDIMVEVVGQAS